MLIIAGHLLVEAADRDAYVSDCRSVVEQARAAPGCLDFAITADTIDPQRIGIFERWSSEAELLAFRGAGPDAETSGRMLGASVRRYVISGEGPP